MIRSIKAVSAGLLSALLLAGCASTGMDSGEKLAMYRTSAGEPVRSFHFFGRLHSWTPLGDRALAVWTKPREAWLLELTGSCPDLAFAHSVSITSSLNTVHARFDRVRPMGAGPMAIACQIGEIRPLDVSALRDAERDWREGGEVIDQPPEDADQSSGVGT
ncbi:DUF6491 family protein [Luteimonas sp. A478]